MTRLVLSLGLGLVVGVMLGLYLGWEQFPTEYIDSPLSLLDNQHKDDYVVMVAYGYVADQDLQGALDRLRPLNVNNIPAFVQEVTERYISLSRGLPDIQHLVALAEGMGRLTPMMESYRLLATPVPAR